MYTHDIYGNSIDASEMAGVIAIRAQHYNQRGYTDEELSVYMDAESVKALIADLKTLVKRAEESSQ